MSEYAYSEIVKQAKAIKTNAEKEYKKPNSKWAYYIAKAIIKPKTTIKKLSIESATKSTGDKFGRQITKNQYLDMAKRLIKYVESKKQIPNYITVTDKHMKGSDFTYMFARILVYYNTNGKLPAYANVNSKAFTKPTETGNAVYDYATKKYGKKFTSLDDILLYVQKHFTYQYYYDDHKSNQQVTDTKAGNCTDLLQWLFNMASALGYECKCIHVKCQGGDGHVRGQFKHPTNTGGKWIDRDIAAVADGSSITSIWCGNGTVIATNPYWFMANLNR